MPPGLERWQNRKENLPRFLLSGLYGRALVLTCCGILFHSTEGFTSGSIW